MLYNVPVTEVKKNKKSWGGQGILFNWNFIQLKILFLIDLFQGLEELDKLSLIPTLDFFLFYSQRRRRCTISELFIQKLLDGYVFHASFS